VGFRLQALGFEAERRLFNADIERFTLEGERPRSIF
jgi:hypothetical protein